MNPHHEGKARQGKGITIVDDNDDVMFVEMNYTTVFLCVNVLFWSNGFSTGLPPSSFIRNSPKKMIHLKKKVIKIIWCRLHVININGWMFECSKNALHFRYLRCDGFNVGFYVVYLRYGDATQYQWFPGFSLIYGIFYDFCTRASVCKVKRDLCVKVWLIQWNFSWVWD